MILQYLNPSWQARNYLGTITKTQHSFPLTSLPAPHELLNVESEFWLKT